MKTYVINLASAVNRRQQIIKQCENHQLNYQIINAINGKELGNEVISTVTADYPTCALTPGEIGCALSHLSIYADLIQNQLDYALILEDDAVLYRSLKETLAAIKPCISKKKPEIYILSSIDNYNPLIAKKAGETVNFYRMAYGSRSHGYIINNSAAQLIINHNLPVKFEADRWTLYRDIFSLQIWCRDREIIGSSDLFSTTSALNEERVCNSHSRGKYLKALKRTYKWYQFKRIKNVLINKISKKTLQNKKPDTNGNDH